MSKQKAALVPVVTYLRMSSDDQTESIERQRTEARELVAQADAIDVLHDEVRGAVRKTTEVCDVDDVGTTDGRGRARFVGEAFDDLAIARHVDAQNLERNALADRLVLRGVNHAHAAFADDALDRVTAVEDLARIRVARVDTGREMLRRLRSNRT